MLGKRICAAVWNFWWLRGHISEGVGWLEKFLQSGGGARDEISLRLLEGAGTLHGWQLDDQTGRTYLMEALQIAREREDEAAIAMILFRHSVVDWVNGKTGQATWLAQQLKACSASAVRWELAHAYLGLGNLLYEAGQEEAAEQALSRSLEYFRMTGGNFGEVFTGSKLALLKSRTGDFQDANRSMRQALQIATQPMDLYEVTYCADNAAQLAVRQLVEPNVAGENYLRPIARVFGAVDRWRTILCLPRGPREKSDYLQGSEILRQWMGEQAYLHARQEGESVPLEKVIQDITEILVNLHQPVRKDHRSMELDDLSVNLSERERQVIALVAEGLTNQEIAERLFITERTVRFHITSILNKLGANNRAQAVAMTNRLGLL